MLLACPIGLAACGGDDSNEAAGPANTVTVVERTKTVTQKESPAPAREEKTPAADPAEADDASAVGGDKITVPNVVGKDHQLAQDTMQAAGLYSLAEKDATGQDQVLLIDRNWTTVAQSPPAGSKVSPDTTITLNAKKDGE